MSNKDRAAAVTTTLLDIIVTALRANPVFFRHARADLLREVGRARPEIEAVLREEFYDIQQTTMHETR